MSETVKKKPIHEVMAKLGLSETEDVEFADLVEDELQAAMEPDDDQRNLNQDLHEQAARITTGPGKRLRLVNGYSTAKGLGAPDDNQTLVEGLLDVELMHAFSLLIDDVNDQDKTRRTFDAVQEYAKNNYLGTDHDAEGLAINQGIDVEFRGLDYFLDPDAEKLSHKDQVNILSRLVEETRKLPRGQKLDIATKWLVDEPEKAQEHLSKEGEEFEFEGLYIDIIDNKTAPLLVAPVRVGAYMAGASEETEMALAEASKYTARAFQIRDDVIEITEGDIGKDRYSDIRDGMMNLPIHYALEALQEEDAVEEYAENAGSITSNVIESYGSPAEYLEGILAKDEVHDLELEIAGDLVIESGATKKANNLAMEFAEKARILYDSVDWQDDRYATAMETMNWYAATRSK